MQLARRSCRRRVQQLALLSVWWLGAQRHIRQPVFHACCLCRLSAPLPSLAHNTSPTHRCCEHGQFEQAVGVALEGRRLDKLEEVVGRSTNPPATLAYALRVCQQLVINRDFRQQVGGWGCVCMWGDVCVGGGGAMCVCADGGV